jgi:hypothetical protein
MCDICALEEQTKALFRKISAFGHAELVLLSGDQHALCKNKLNKALDSRFCRF